MIGGYSEQRFSNPHSRLGKLQLNESSGLQSLYPPQMRSGGRLHDRNLVYSKCTMDRYMLRLHQSVRFQQLDGVIGTSTKWLLASSFLHHCHECSQLSTRASTSHDGQKHIAFASNRSFQHIKASVGTSDRQPFRSSIVATNPLLAQFLISNSLSVHDQ